MSENNPSVLPAFWSAIAASFAALSSFLTMRIQRRNLFDSAKPEIVLSDWSRKIVKQGEPDLEVIEVKRIKNIGRGPAFHVSLNASKIDGNRPLHTASTTHLAIIGQGEELDLSLKISVWWKNAELLQDGKIISINISISCFDSKNIKHITRYYLLAGDRQISLFAGNEVADDLFLVSRTTNSKSVMNLKIYRHLSKIPWIGRIFKSKME